MDGQERHDYMSAFMLFRWVTKRFYFSVCDCEGVMYI
jgi:hypothetical protein